MYTGASLGAYGILVLFLFYLGLFFLDLYPKREDASDFVQDASEAKPFIIWLVSLILVIVVGAILVSDKWGRMEVGVIEGSGLICRQYGHAYKYVISAEYYIPKEYVKFIGDRVIDKRTGMTFNLADCYEY